MGCIKVPQDVQDVGQGLQGKPCPVVYRILFGSSRRVMQVAVRIRMSAKRGFRFARRLIGERCYDGFRLDGKRNGSIELPCVRHGNENLSFRVELLRGRYGAQGGD